MAFVPQPLFPGDLYEAAAKLARTAEASRGDPADQVAAQARQWAEAVALGWPAIGVPEALGGLGGSVDDLAALVDGAASGGLSLPLASLCGVVPALLAAAPSETVSSLVAAVASGAERLCPVLDAVEGWSVNPRPPAAVRDETGGIGLQGTAMGVEVVPDATTFLLPCPVSDGSTTVTGLLLIPAAALPPPRRFLRVDGRLAADLLLDGVMLPGDAVLAQGAAVERQVAAALDLGTVLTCVEVVSSLGGALACTIAYLAGRKQFGVPLATMQALRHRVAELYIAYETSRALVAAVLAALTAGKASRAVALAKARLGTLARSAAETVIQLHGGMGLTEELPATRFNKRLLMAEFDYGDAPWHARQALRAPLAGGAAA